MESTRIIVDYNNLAHRSLHSRKIPDGSDERDWGLWAYIAFTTLYDFVLEVGQHLEGPADVVLALDSRDGYWRRDLYAPYKMDRARRREGDGIDWPRVYAEFNRLSDALGRHTPWKVLQVSKCEADDIIYALATDSGSRASVIYSSDSDYLQLVDERVLVYSPTWGDYANFPLSCKVAGAEVYCRTPEDYLRYAVLTGQGGKDNVYNVKTPTDWDVEGGKRKPGFGVAAATKVLEDKRGLETALREKDLWHNYLRNKALIDMRELPEVYRQSILDANRAYAPPGADIAALCAEYDWPSLHGLADDMSARLDILAEGGTLPEEAAPHAVPEESGGFAFSL